MIQMALLKTIGLWVISTLGVFVVIALLVGWWLSAPAYKGAKLDNFDGKTFINREGYQNKGFLDLMKWATTRRPGPWMEKTDADVEFGQKPVARVSDSTQVITYVNHSTFLIQTDGLNILTDPVWSERVSPFTFAGPKRMRPPGIRFEDLPEIDAVLISHNHYDHLDLATLLRIKDRNPKTRFITPLGIDLYLNKKGIKNTFALNWWEGLYLNDSTSVDAVEAQHFSSRGMLDRDKTLWAGFVIKSPKGNIYFAGDTGYNNFFREIGERYAPIKTAIIPIGAYIPRWFMSPVHVDPAQAVQIHHDVGAEMSIGMHFGTFPLADDGEQQPLNDLEITLNGENFIVIKEGSNVVIE
jgi:L-ascorbate metabolism protein UlaG (beta-lactamase superfamily)